MIVGTCGFGSTGSSAINDYLLEFNDVKVLDDIEFYWVYDTDSIVDLEFHLMHPHCRTMDSITAIQRYQDKVCNHVGYFGGIDKEFLVASANKFIDSITMVKWDWYRFDKDSKIKLLFKKELLAERIIPRVEKKLKKRITCYPMQTVRFSIKPDNFYIAAKKHVNELLEKLGADLKKDHIIVLNQPFPGNNPQCCFPFFDDPRAIVVDRDPRDNYVFARTKLIGSNHFMPTENVKEFVEYYRSLREKQPFLNNDERILRLQFEDLVYRYDETTDEVRKFLGLPENPRPKTVFDPALSIANTQVYKRFPQFAEDVKYIEKNLAEYIYDFDQYGEVNITGEMFDLRSPLHK